jgi:hypothetical protein
MVIVTIKDVAAWVLVRSGDFQTPRSASLTSALLTPQIAVIQLLYDCVNN